MIRLLLDQNISFRVLKQLKSNLPNTVGVQEVGLLNADDYEIWEYARQNDYVVVTFDKDIPMIGSVKGFPPKIIWLRTGNMSNQALVNLLLNRLDEFIDFNNRQSKGCLLVYHPQSTEP